MKNKFISFMLLLASNNIFANPTAQEIEDEITGFSSEPQTTPTPDSNSRLIAMGTLVDSGLLLIPESTNDRVMAFDPMTGNLLDGILFHQIQQTCQHQSMPLFLQIDNHFLFQIKLMMQCSNTI